MTIKNTVFLALISFFTVQCSTLVPLDKSSQAVGETAEFRPDSAKSFEVDAQQSRNPASVEEVSNKTDIDYQFALAETYSLEGNPEKAVEGFKAVLIKDPDSTTVMMRIALEYVKLGVVSEAVKYTEQVQLKEPKNIEAKLLLGGLYSTLKLYEKAIQSYKSVIDLDKSYEAEATLYLGAIYAEKNDVQNALASFDKVAQSKDDKFKHLAYYYLGRIQFFKGDISKAEDSYKKALNHKKDFVDAVLALGGMYEEKNRDQDAVKLYASYQEQTGPDINVAKALSQLYLQNEKYDKAYSQYEIILANEPDNIAVKIRMALIDIERKEYKVAIQRLKEILVIAPDSDKVRFYLAAVLEEMDFKAEAIDQFVKIPYESQFYGEAIVHAAYLYRAQNQVDKAEKLLDEALKNRTDYSQFYALKASLLDEKRKYNDAEKILVKGANLFPENEQILFFLGSVQDKLGKKLDTIVSMKKVIALNDSHTQALNYLAYTYAELGKELVEAENLAKRALNLKPNDAYIIDTLGWVYFKQGKNKEAMEYLEKAHSINPNEGVIAEHLGDVYFKVQLYAKAQDMYEKAVRVERNEANQRKIESKILQIKKAISDNYNRVPASSY